MKPKRKIFTEEFQKFIDSKLKLNDTDFGDWYDSTIFEDLSDNYEKFISLDTDGKLNFIESLKGDEIFRLLFDVIDGNAEPSKIEYMKILIEYVRIVNPVNKRGLSVRGLI